MILKNSFDRIFMTSKGTSGLKLFLKNSINGSQL